MYFLYMLYLYIQALFFAFPFFVQFSGPRCKKAGFLYVIIWLQIGQKPFFLGLFGQSVGSPSKIIHFLASNAESSAKSVGRMTHGLVGRKFRDGREFRAQKSGSE